VSEIKCTVLMVGNWGDVITCAAGGLWCGLMLPVLVSTHCGLVDRAKAEELAEVGGLGFKD